MRAKYLLCVLFLSLFLISSCFHQQSTVQPGISKQQAESIALNLVNSLLPHDPRVITSTSISNSYEDNQYWNVVFLVHASGKDELGRYREETSQFIYQVNKNTGLVENICVHGECASLKNLGIA